MKCTTAQEEVEKELGCVFLMWNSVDGEHHSAVALEDLNTGPNQNVGESFG